MPTLSTHIATEKLTRLNLQGIALFALMSVILLLSWSNQLDQLTTHSIEETLKQAGIAFGFAKMLNGLVSVMQSTEFQVSVGAGMSIAIGES